MKEVENDPTYSDKQRQLYKDRLDDLNTKKQTRLKNIITKSKRSSNEDCKNESNS